MTWIIHPVEIISHVQAGVVKVSGERERWEEGSRDVTPNFK
jgi:hypothetical protein